MASGSQQSQHHYAYDDTPPPPPPPPYPAQIRTPPSAASATDGSGSGAGSAVVGLGQEAAAAALPSFRRGSLTTSSARGGSEATSAVGEGHSAASSRGPPHHSQMITGGGLPPKPIRRRMRMITSCLECRRRKLKCNKSSPCTNCTKFSRDCFYLGPKLDEASQLRLTEIKEKVGSLERQLERDVAKSTTRGGGEPFRQQSIVADGVDENFEEEADLELTPMVALDLTYEDDADGADDLTDLGIQVGRMRITERIGGLNRPRISEELRTGLTGTRTNPTTPTASAYATSSFSDVDGMSDPTTSSDPPTDVLPDFLRPGASYIPPTSGFFFGQVGESPSIMSFLPQRNIGDSLMQRYFAAVHPIARCVHWPSFEATYDSFWEDIDRGYEPRPSVQAIVFAAWFSAAVSLDKDWLNREIMLAKAQMVEAMKIGTETALSKANFLRTTRVETLQAFVMYLLPLCREEVSRAHSVLVGAAVRMAECMGLHRDGEAYGLNSLETHVRRLIWHQLCFLDIRTCEAQGPRPGIRREDYDTKPPLNCEENELTAHVNGSLTPAEHWTPTLLTIMRFELNEMMRIVWCDRRKLETRRTTLTAVLTKIEIFRKRLDEKYNHLLDDRVPSQKYAKLVKNLLIYRLYAMLLHPYHTNTTNPLPERLRDVLIVSGVMIVEISFHLETNEAFRDWAWYLGAYQQFQIALLLATEIYYRPNNVNAGKIWGCLDYVFNLDPNMPRDQKSFRILSEIMTKAAVYTDMRKIRAPTALANAVPDKQAIKDSPSPMAPPSTPQPSYQHQQEHQHQQQHQHHQQQYQPPDMMFHTIKAEPGMSSMTDMSPMVVPSQGPASHGIVPPPPCAPMPHNMVYAGISNGEVFWGFPLHNPTSLENSSSDGASVASQPQHPRNMSTGSGHGGWADDNMLWDIETINNLFPPDPQTGHFNFNSFDSGIGMPMNWAGCL
ncbi:hypothetical protein B0T17DRAFT_496287 [Bombardia bombarda]|uniref:Zn(2)-C6 fungal-type domain-containing protein n=1 Tax=Bombardia bombarda TaxID=252184 RepID=A0AA40BYG9_9PEZI|nr:hypothetical protein B0T17DRAFT_496287 [Bombardia bombarda]